MAFFEIIIWAIAFSWAILNLYWAGFGAFHNMLQGSVVIIFGFILCFYKYTFLKNKKETRIEKGINLILIALGVLTAVYVIANADRFLQNYIIQSNWDIILAFIMLALILEGSRRVIGLVMPLISIFFILYALLGPLLPMPWTHMGFNFRQILQHLYLNLAGFWGTITYVIVAVIPIYMVLGAIIFSSGGGDAFVGIGSFIGGRTDGGAGKIAVVSSALFGMISGSAVANVATTGSLTIPTMKKLGYSPELAGAIEATASTGGQIMPPVMGAGAFIMAEILSIPYLEVIKAAAIPAVLYFLGAYFGVHFEAKRIRLGKPPKELISSLTFRPFLSFLIPVAILLILLIENYTPMYSAFWAVIAGMGFFILGGGRFSKMGDRIKIMAGCLVESSHSLVMIVFIGFCAQVTVSLIGLTGVGIKFSDIIISLAGDSLLLSLILTAVVTLFLGMGVPTVAAYLIAASVIAPALISFKILPLGAHLFIFYFAVIACITPPVCAAVYVAAGIAESNWFQTGIVACKLGVASFIVPFIFVYSPELLLQGNLLMILLAISTSLLGVIVLSSASIGFFLYPLRFYERIILLGASICLIKPGWITDILGIAMVAGILLLHSGKGGVKLRRAQSKSVTPGL